MAVDSGFPRPKTVFLLLTPREEGEGAMCAGGHQHDGQDGERTHANGGPGGERVAHQGDVGASCFSGVLLAGRSGIWLLAKESQSADGVPPARV